MKIKLTITGLDCPNCAAKLADKMSNAEGITSAKINFLTEKLTVETELSEDDAIALLSKIATAFEKGIVIEK